MSKGRISTFRAWEMLNEQGLTWRERVIGLGDAAWFGSGSGKRAEDELDEVLERLRTIDEGLLVDVEDCVSGLIVTALGFGVLLGYALARTFPNNFEGMDAWLDNAIGYAGIRDYPPIQDDDDCDEGDADARQVRRAC